MVPGRLKALDRYDAGTAAIESRRLAGQSHLSADPDEAAVLNLFSDVLIGDSDWTVGEVRRLLDLRDSGPSDPAGTATQDPETALR
jgi:hypothetical protein